MEYFGELNQVSLEVLTANYSAVVCGENPTELQKRRLSALKRLLMLADENKVSCFCTTDCAITMACKIETDIKLVENTNLQTNSPVKLQMRANELAKLQGKQEALDEFSQTFVPESDRGYYWL